MKQKIGKQTILAIALSALLLTIFLILTIDSKSFNENLVWPMSYKNSSYMGFIVFFAVYFISLVLFALFSLFRNEKNETPCYIMIAFEVYAYLSPMFFKSDSILTAYFNSLFDITQQRFYTRTLKSLIFIVALILIIVALKSDNKKTILCFCISSCLLLAISLTHLFIVGGNALSFKNILVCLFRFLPILPLYFLNYKKDSIMPQ